MGTLKIPMKFATLAVVALFGNVIAQDEEEGGEEEEEGMEVPEEAIGDCADSSECAEGEFCVFTHIVPEEGADKAWEPSVCGTEEECNPAEDGSALVPGDAWSWCMEFMKEEEEEGSMRLAATMAASFTALALSM